MLDEVTFEHDLRATPWGRRERLAFVSKVLTFQVKYKDRATTQPIHCNSLSVKHTLSFTF